MKELFRMLSIQNFKTEARANELLINDATKDSSLKDDLKKNKTIEEKQNTINGYYRKGARYLTYSRIIKSDYFQCFEQVSKMKKPLDIQQFQVILNTYSYDKYALTTKDYIKFKQQVIESFVVSYMLQTPELSMLHQFLRFIGLAEAFLYNVSNFERFRKIPTLVSIPIGKLLKAYNLENKSRGENIKSTVSSKKTLPKDYTKELSESMEKLKKVHAEIVSLTEENFAKRKYLPATKKKEKGKKGEKDSIEIPSPLRMVKAPLSKEAKSVLASVKVNRLDFLADDLLEKINSKITSEGTKYFLAKKANKKVSYQGAVFTTNKIDKSFAKADSPKDEPQPNIPEFNPASGRLVKVLGEGKLLKVEEKLKGYRLGRISQVINIPAGSTKGIENRILEKSVTTSESESEQSQSEETSRDSRENTNLGSETQKILDSDISLQAGFNVSAQYGPTVGVQANTNFSSTLSSSETTDSSFTYAKDVTERAAKKISQRQISFVRQEISREKEEKYNEQYQNPTPNHIMGIYQFIDEITEARLLQYDTRLLLEFLVPEPGNLLLYAPVHVPIAGDTLIPPEPFEIEDGTPLTPDDLDVDNYLGLTSLWGARDIPVYPKTYTRVSKAYDIGNGVEKGKDKRKNIVFKDDTLSIPDGYKGKEISGRIAASHNDFEGATGGRVRLVVQKHSYSFDNRSFDFVQDAINYGNIPIALTGYEDRAFSLNIIVSCDISTEAIHKWKLAVWTKLKDAYDKAIEDYYEKTLRVKRNASLTGGSLSNNPEINRQVEKEELKRGCISLLTRQSFELFDSINENADNLPTINFTQVKDEGNYITFFENAFEWTQLTYLLYPYFWASPEQTWMRSLNLKLDDKKHEEFLKSGFARVIVPVRVEYQSAILQFLQSGRRWDGQDPDTVVIGNPLYEDISAQLMERQGQLKQNVEQIGAPWEVTIPTNIQIISNGTILPTPPFI